MSSPAQPHPANCRRRACTGAILFGLALALGAPSFAADETQDGRIAVSVDAGTPGFGASLWFTAAPQFVINVGYARYNLTHSYATDGTEYDGEADLKNLTAMVNWHPGGHWFHFSGGVVYANDEVSLTGKPGPGATYDLNGVSYPASLVGSIMGRAQVADGLLPYVGIGWSSSPRHRGWGGYLDLGVMFSGSPTAKLSASGSIAGDPTFQSDLAREEKNLNDHIDQYRYFPVIRAGVMYRF